MKKEELGRKEQRTGTQTNMDKWTQTTVKTKDKSTQTNFECNKRRRRDENKGEGYREKKQTKEEYICQRKHVRRIRDYIGETGKKEVRRRRRTSKRKQEEQRKEEDHKIE